MLLKYLHTYLIGCTRKTVPTAVFVILNNWRQATHMSINRRIK